MECKQKLVDAGIIPVLVELFDSLDIDVQYYSISILASITRGGKSIPLPPPNSLRYPVADLNRKELTRSEPRLVEILVQYMDSSSLKVQSEAARALAGLALDGECQVPTSRDILLTTHYRELSVGNCEGLWSESPPSPPSVTGPRLDRYCGQMCLPTGPPTYESLPDH